MLAKASTRFHEGRALCTFLVLGSSGERYPFHNPMFAFDGNVSPLAFSAVLFNPCLAFCTRIDHGLACGVDCGFIFHLHVMEDLPVNPFTTALLRRRLVRRTAWIPLRPECLRRRRVLQCLLVPQDLVQVRPCLAYRRELCRHHLVPRSLV
jgi:hypothetical protein